ncbi:MULTISPECIES: hypothetical protein [Paraburkholderia]|uniref:hypothetical protein n=1 Tax=Paraburkholderia TaxID=1822464 RepID=UPI00225B167F|nr:MULTISPECIES: hypothetical protein [Paraburkholderia]MCX4177524.1 hypothetical protein [Paraburkholderia madseniana]MDQ6465513.1 hypothetical protein [Paraburkholderia madseniana]
MTANVERGTNEKHRDLMSEGRKLDWELLMRPLAIVAAWFGAKRARGFAKTKEGCDIAIAGRRSRSDGAYLAARRVARSVDRRYVRVRLKGRAELLLVERNGCNDGLERHHQIRMTLSKVLPRRIVFEELDEISFRKH